MLRGPIVSLPTFWIGSLSISSTNYPSSDQVTSPPSFLMSDSGFQHQIFHCRPVFLFPSGFHVRLVVNTLIWLARQCAHPYPDAVLALQLCWYLNLRSRLGSSGTRPYLLSTVYFLGSLRLWFCPLGLFGWSWCLRTEQEIHHTLSETVTHDNNVGHYRIGITLYHFNTPPIIHVWQLHAFKHLKLFNLYISKTKHAAVAAKM